MRKMTWCGRFHRSVLHRQTKGTILLSTLMLLVVLAILGSIAISTTSTETQISGSFLTSTQAFFVAEAGLRRAVGNLKADHNWITTLADTNNAFAGDNAMNNGTYVVQVLADTPNPDQDTILSTGTIAGANASSATVEAITTEFSAFNPSEAMIFGNNLKVNGQPTLQGSCGGVHTNGDLYLEGTPDLGMTATASGSITISVSATATVGGTVLDTQEAQDAYTASSQNASTEAIPMIDPSDFASYADYHFEADGNVYDAAGNLMGVDGWDCWSHNSQGWTASGTACTHGSFYFEGSVAINNAEGTAGTPWQVSVLATGDIDVGSSPYLANYKDASDPVAVQNLIFVAGGDIKIVGRAEQIWHGIIAANEQIQVGGSAQVEGLLMAADAANASNLVQENKLHGNVTITCGDKMDNPFKIHSGFRIVSWRSVFN